MREEELEELVRLLAVERRSEGLDEAGERRLRTLLAREQPSARNMDWAELMKFANLVIGLHLVKRRAREYGKSLAKS